MAPAVNPEDGVMSNSAPPWYSSSLLCVPKAMLRVLSLSVQARMERQTPVSAVATMLSKPPMTWG